MKLVVGLGNPGARYETTRHNVGFLAVDWLIDEWGATKKGTKFNGELFSATVQDETIYLLKPQTFMNVSGESVGPALGFFKGAAKDLIVIYDEIDLDPFSIRIKIGGGSGGHNGIKSIDQCVGQKNKEYLKIRLGVGRPGPGDHRDVADYVLSPFLDDELTQLDEIFKKVEKAVKLLIQGKVTDAMNRYNRKG